MKFKIPNTVKSAIKFFAAAALIYWIFATDKINTQNLLKLLSLEFLLIGFTLNLLNTIAVSERWRAILGSQGINLSFFETLKLTLIGAFFNFAMPGGVGGDLIKGYYLLSDYPQKKVAALTSVAMDRILGLFTMIIMALVVMIVDFQHIEKIPLLLKLFYMIVALFSLASLGLFLGFSRSPKVTHFIHKALHKLPFQKRTQQLYESIHIYGRDHKMIFRVLILSLLAQVFSILLMVVAGEKSGLDLGAPVSLYFLVAPLGFMAIAIPISPAGLGVGQAAFYVLFNIYLSQQSQLGPTVITALQAFQLAFGICGSIFYLTRKQKITKELSSNLI